LSYAFDPTGTVIPLDILYHQAGLTQDEKFDSNPLSLEEYVNKVATLPLLFEPGTKWNYSVASDVCGRLVEILSGLRLDEFFHRRIFVPLGMHNTWFKLPLGQEDRLVNNYMSHREGKGLHDVSKSTVKKYHPSHPFLSGGGGLLSTVEDYSRFCSMLLGRGKYGHRRIIGERTLEFMTTNQLPDNKDMFSLVYGGHANIFNMGMAQKGVGFGLGFSIMMDPVGAKELASVGVFGWGGLASTRFWVDPKEGFYVLFFTQLFQNYGFPILATLQRLIYTAIEETSDDREDAECGKASKIRCRL